MCFVVLFFSVWGVGWVGEMGGVGWRRWVSGVGGGGVGIYTRALTTLDECSLHYGTTPPTLRFILWVGSVRDWIRDDTHRLSMSDHLVPSWWHCSERFWTLGIGGSPSSLEEAGDLRWVLRFYSPALVPALLPDCRSNVTICVTCQLSGPPCYMGCISLNCKLWPTLPPLRNLITSKIKRMN